MTDNINPNQQPDLSEQDAELLSAYMDNVLPIDERRALEARLNNEPFLQRELSALRQTVAWINTLPTLKAPRDFTISAEDVTPVPQKIVKMPQRNNTWLLASVAAIIVVIIGVVAILPSLSPAPLANTASEQVAFANTAIAPTDFVASDEADDGIGASDNFSADSVEEAPPAPEISRNIDPETQAQESSAGIDNRSLFTQPANIMSGQGSAPENASDGMAMDVMQAEPETTEIVIANDSYDDTAPNANIASASASAVMSDAPIEEAEAEDMQGSDSDMPEADTDTVMMDTLEINPIQRVINLLATWLELIRQIFNIIQAS